MAKTASLTAGLVAKKGEAAPAGVLKAPAVTTAKLVGGVRSRYSTGLLQGADREA